MKSLINSFEQKLEYIFTGFNENSRGYAWYDLNEAFGSEKLSVEQKAKELFIYLANWGMVARGSFLMKHTWRILRYNNVRIILSATGIASAKFDDDSIKSLCEYYTQNSVDFERLRKKVEERTKKKCPPFKLLDLILYSAANMDSSDGSEE